MGHRGRMRDGVNTYLFAIDVNAHASQFQWPIEGLRIKAQLKRWLHTIGRREVAEPR